jgi:para-nitrobenzyl esterase
MRKSTLKLSLLAAVASSSRLGMSLGAAHAASGIGVVTTEGGKVSGVDTDVPGVESSKESRSPGPPGATTGSSRRSRL